MYILSFKKLVLSFDMKSQSFKDYCIKAKQYALRTVISLGKCRDQEGTQILNPAEPRGHG